MVAAEVLAALAERGWEILLVTPPDSGLIQDPRLKGKVEFLPLDLDTDRLPALAMIPVIRQIVQLSRQYPHAVWYGNTYRSLKWLALAKLAGDVRNVCHLHESYYRPYYYLRTRWLASLIDSFICISETVRKEIIQGTGRMNLPARTIYNGLPSGPPGSKTSVDKETLRVELGLPLANPLVCMVGRSDLIKGHDIFLNAAAKVAKVNPAARFIVLGGTWNEPGRNEFETQIKAQREALALNDIVLLLPHHARIRDYMRCADIVVVPSRSEGFGRVAVEAMMEQTAVIASRVGGLAEIIQDNETGLLVPPDDAERLAQAMQQMLTDESLRERCVAAGYSRSQQEFSQMAMLDQIERELLTVGGAK